MGETEEGVAESAAQGAKERVAEIEREGGLHLPKQITRRRPQDIYHTAFRQDSDDVKEEK